MTTKTYGPYSARSPRRSYRYLDGIPEEVSYPRLRWVDYLCEDCEERNNAARADVFHRLDQRLAATIRRYTTWLGAAPSLPRSLEELPPHVAPFYEIWEIAAAADAIARDLRHYERVWLGREGKRLQRGALELNDDHPLAPFSPNCAPRSYTDIVTKNIVYQDEWTLSTGSVFRADGDRIVVNWHTQRTRSILD
jgi:hypothetical protein